MTKKIKWLVLPVIVLLSACELFLGQNPDTGPPEVLKSLWNDFNNIHANLDIRMSNNTHGYTSWYDVYYNKQDGYAGKVNPNMSDESLFYLCGNMLKELNDPHVALFAPNKSSGSYFPGDFKIEKVRELLNGTGYAGYTNFLFGTFSLEPDIGYIHISSFMGDKSGNEWGKAIDTILRSLANTKVLILDVRNNGGGDVSIMEYIAARFTSAPKDYLKARVKTGPGLNDLSGPIIYTVKSISKMSGNQYGYTKPIILMTNRSSVSAAEWFTLALRTQSHVTHVGTPTCGALSVRNDRFMINGWAYSISPERVTDMNGKLYEGIGIYPDIGISENPSNPKDEQLLGAVEKAKGLK